MHLNPIDRRRWLWVYLRSQPFSYCNGRVAKPLPSCWPLSSPRQSRLCSEPSVALLGDVTEIPNSLPPPVLPDFGAIPQLLLPALSLTIVGLAVAAGVSQSYPETDGSIPNASRDFVGQGTANAEAPSKRVRFR